MAGCRDRAQGDRRRGLSPRGRARRHPRPQPRSRHWSRSISPQAFSRTGRRSRAKAIGLEPGLRIVARLGVGLDNIAVDEATRRGIWVTNVPDYCFEEVADHSVGMLLAFTRGLVHFDREVRAGRWEPATARLRRMSTLTVRHRRLRAHRPQHRAETERLRRARARLHAQPRARKKGVEFVALDDAAAPVGCGDRAHPAHARHEASAEPRTPRV